MSAGVPEGAVLTSPAAAAAGDDAAYVEAAVRRSGTSFYWAMRLQPPPQRGAMFAVYAFCREVDDIADDPGDPADKSRRLADWRVELDRVYAGRPQRPVGRALVAPVATFGLRREDFEAILKGMETDAADTVRLADQQALDLYCDRVACAVGRLSVRVFGAPEAVGIRLAHALGNALQLTNILRDLAEDAARDRLYLPAAVLADHGIDAAAPPLAVLADARTAHVCAAMARTAEQRFREAEALLAQCERRPLRPARVMMEVYRRTLKRLTARGWERWREPAPLSAAEKLWVAFRYGML